MAVLILFNKPFGVLSQFTDPRGRDTLKKYIDIPGVYPAGRLDKDSEGLLILTDDGKLQQKIADPIFKLVKYYWVQVEGEISEKSLEKLRSGVLLKDGITQTAQVKVMQPPANLWGRNPPIRDRKSIPTKWLEICIREGRNRQIRRMTAAVNHPTLRLIRFKIGSWDLGTLLPGQYSKVDI